MDLEVEICLKMAGLCHGCIGAKGASFFGIKALSFLECRVLCWVSSFEL